MKSEKLLSAWKAEMKAEVAHESARSRWGLALMVIGWFHLVMFILCQATHDPKVQSNPWHVARWAIDFFGSLVALRLVAGKGWFRAAAAGIIIRIWCTFFIIAFNVVVLNNMMGWDRDWFKPVWCSLSSFGFATMAWLFDRKFLIPAFQMYFTGLLMIRFPHFSYLIYGISWCLALQYIGFTLEKDRRSQFVGREWTQGIGKSRRSKGTSVATAATPK